jgi:hypothetical protein
VLITFQRALYGQADIVKPVLDPITHQQVIDPKTHEPLTARSTSCPTRRSGGTCATSASCSAPLLFLLVVSTRPKHPPRSCERPVTAIVVDGLSKHFRLNTDRLPVGADTQARAPPQTSRPRHR